MLLQPFNAPAGQEYTASAYPGIGVYINANKEIRIVYRLVGCHALSVMYIGQLDAESSEKLFEPEKVQGTSASEDFMLKLVAITRNPELIKDLT